MKRLGLVELIPKLHEHFLIGSGFGGLQIPSTKFFEGQGLLAINQGALKPEELCIGKALVCLLKQLAMSLTPHLINGFIEVLRDVKTVMHNLGFWDCSLHGGNECSPHVQAHSLHLLELLFMKALKEANRGNLCASRHRPPARSVGYDR